MRTRRSRLAAIAAATAAAAVGGIAAAGPAAACGGLIGENGSISLVRTTTLAAWHDGVEHYVTSFEFAGTGESVGSIIPLPGVPTTVEPGGEWTLQRLQLEVAPPLREQADFDTSSGGGAPAPATVLLETEVDALDITVLQGGGDAVGEWALDNGFFLTPDAPEVLDYYGDRSQIFLAAKFDAARAAAQGLADGQATPVHITIPTPRPWVPLRILGLGLPADQQVDADIFLLTDDRPELLAGGDGLDVERSEPASASLLSDLRSDRGMGWVPEQWWLTHLVLGEQAGDLDYDLSVGTDRRTPSLLDAGLVATDGGLDRLADAVDPAAGGNGIGRVAAWTALVAGGALLLGAGAVRLRTARPGARR